MKSIFEKSLAVNKDLPKNHTITFDDLEAKKPKGYGILASDYEKVLGKKVNNDLKKWSFLNFEDLPSVSLVIRKSVFLETEFEGGRHQSRLDMF